GVGGGELLHVEHTGPVARQQVKTFDRVMPAAQTLAPQRQIDKNLLRLSEIAAERQADDRWLAVKFDRLDFLENPRHDFRRKHSLRARRRPKRLGMNQAARGRYAHPENLGVGMREVELLRWHKDPGGTRGGLD